MNSKITPKRDQRNKRIISLSIFNVGGMPVAGRHRLMHEASPEERADYVRKQTKCLIVTTSVIVAFFILAAIIPLG